LRAAVDNDEREFSGTDVSQAHRLEELGKGNGRLKLFVAATVLAFRSPPAGTTGSNTARD
jgi:hypothetical protein